MTKSIATENATPSTATAAAPGLAGIDLALWICLLAALLWLRLAPAFTPALSPDSFQYLSAAKNMLQGSFGYTSLIHYDAERSLGVVPAPLVTYPLGYPLLIALTSLFGASLESAAWIVSAVSTIASVPVVAWIAKQLGFSRMLCNAVTGALVVNGAIVGFGGSALAEAPFTFCVLLGTALLLHAAEPPNRQAWLRWAAAGCAFAAAYTMRYAGLFFIVALAVSAAHHALAGHSARARGYATALGVSLVPVVLVVSRNLALVGNWRGRDEMAVSIPFQHVLLETEQALNALFLGSGTAAATPVATYYLKAIFAGLVVAGLALLSRSRARDRAVADGSESADRVRRGIDVLVLVAAYMICMFYAGMTTAISYGSARNFVPVAALLILLLGWIVRIRLDHAPRSDAIRRIAMLLLAVGLLPYAYLNYLVLRRPPVDASSLARARLEAVAHSGKVTRVAIAEIVGKDGVIMANDGQAVGHVLGLRTISLASSTFSTVVWDEATVQSTIRRFNVNAMVVTAPMSGYPDDDNMPSAFTHQLAYGSSPSWLRLALRSDRVLVYVPEPHEPSTH